MRHIFAALFATCMCLCVYSGQGEVLSMKGISSELEEAFLDKPQGVMKKGRVPQGTASGGKERSIATGEEWQVRLAAILDMPAVPLPEGFNLKLLEAPGEKFIITVFDTGEEHMVQRAKQIAWLKVRALFAGGVVPLLHIVPATGGTFSAGRAFYTIASGGNGFNVFHIPQRSARKGSLVFSGDEGAFLTPDGFVCRIKRYTSEGGGKIE